MNNAALKFGTYFRLMFVLVLVSSSVALAQEVDLKPMTNEEFIRELYQLPKRPGLREQLVQEIRQRGIDFPLTPGLKGLIATKSGSDEVLRRTLEEADRRRSNPNATTHTLPPAAEAADLLARTKVATLGAADAMPDFVVRQEISRSIGYANRNNWEPGDHLTVAVSYRASAGEDYKLLAINGVPNAAAKSGKSDYMRDAGGATSTGEYVSMLALLFADETKAEINAVDTDTLRGRPTIVYEYEVKKENSHQNLVFKDVVETSTITGYKGKIWVDREQNRIIRLQSECIEIPAGFPITASFTTIDYDFVTINGRSHLLPIRAEVRLTQRYKGTGLESKNLIRFKDYQKYGTEVKIIEDVEPDDDAPKAPPKKP